MNRPKLHFTPYQGWMNDPNGTICADGLFHLFFQHNPKGTSWGNICWGHAQSQDLIHWKEEEIALSPDDMGLIFSGSCLRDRDNLSGLAMDGNVPILAFYTVHNPKTGIESQCLAYSQDCIHFEKYPGNPIIANPGENYPDFRDPKVFVNPQGGYSMALACGHLIEFYASEDLIHWEKTGDFDPSRNGFPGICECPDCFPLTVTNPNTQEEETYYVLSMSMVLEDHSIRKEYDLCNKEYYCGRVMQYFIGSFDGKTFTDTRRNEQPLIVDYGPDHYAMVTFAEDHPPKDRRLAIGWAENWEYVADAPDILGLAKGKMTIARSLSLLYTEAGIRLCQKPVLADNCFDNRGAEEGAILYIDNLQPVCFHLNLSDEGNVRIRDGLSERLRIEVKRDEIKVNTDRGCFNAGRVLSGPCDLDILYDAGLLEIFADQGTRTFTINIYSE